MLVQLFLQRRCRCHFLLLCFLLNCYRLHILRRVLWQLSFLIYSCRCLIYYLWLQNYFFHLSSRTLIKYPPTTLLAWKPTWLPSVVSCQSLNGTLVGVAVE